VAELAPGVHVVGNADPDDRRVPKVARLLDAAGAAAQGPEEALLDALAAVCRDHDTAGGPLGAACVHAGDYGTRSSTLLCLAQDPERSALRHAEGPPCEARYRDRTPLLRALRDEPGRVRDDRHREEEA
jgi:hypothetical protein